MDPAEHPAPGLTGRLPPRVDVYEVGPRDGLQNELRIVPLEGKLRLIRALARAGERRIEATSFVSPRWIPQLSDAEDVLKALPRGQGVVYSALVPNRKGLDRAVAAGLEEAAVFISASESHSRKNINKSIAEAVSVATDVAKGALAAGMRVRAYLSVVWGCPYEGPVSVERVVELCRKLADSGIYQLSLGDTIGVGVPNQTEEILGAVTRYVPVTRLALHLHDTRGLALANALVGLSAGVTTFDASIGLEVVPTPGAGGPRHRGPGQHAPPDGVETGIDLEKLVEAGGWRRSSSGGSWRGSSSGGAGRTGGRGPRRRSPCLGVRWPPAHRHGAEARTGSAAVIVLAGEARDRILAKNRIVMATTFETGAVYHAAQELPLDKAAAHVEKSERRFEELAVQAIEKLRKELGPDARWIGGALVSAPARPKVALADIVKAHPRVHAAEGELYKGVVERAMATAGLSVQRIAATDLVARVTEASGLRAPEVERMLAALGKASGPPWTKEQKECALAAWALLG